MVQNSLSNATDNEMKVSYDSNGETVNLSPSIVKKYLTSSPNVTDQEIMMFISLCKFQKLNPFLREAYLIKYGNAPATLITGKDVFIKRARKQRDFAGFQAGIIVYSDETANTIEREGTFYDEDTETLLGGWAKVFVKGYDVPFYASVSLKEYQGLKQDGTPNGQWSSKPATMIRKVALSQALREAYPIETAGMYEPEEAGVVDEAPEAEVNNIKPANVIEPAPAPAPAPVSKKKSAPAPVREPEPVEPPVAPEEKIEAPNEYDDIQNALFGGLGFEM